MMIVVVVIPKRYQSSSHLGAPGGYDGNGTWVAGSECIKTCQRIKAG